MRFQVLVKEGLEGADRELLFGIRYGDKAVSSAEQVLDYMAPG